METKEFKIRLLIHVEGNSSPNYVDELPSEKYANIDCLDCEFNWLKTYNSQCSEELFKYYELLSKIEEGYNDNDVSMNVKFENGYIHVTLTTPGKFDTPVTVLENEKTLITRTLFEWIKIAINGQLGDGIGEDAVAVYKDGEQKYDIWLTELITDEETDDHGRYFAIGKPLHIEQDSKVINALFNPELKNEYTNLFMKYHDSCRAHDNKAGEIYEQMLICKSKQYEHILKQLENMGNKEENIFEGAKFGDRFITRAGCLAIFISHSKNGWTCAVQEKIDKSRQICYDIYGKIGNCETMQDIMSKYQEPIDEDNLDKLAKEYALEELGKEHYPEFGEIKRDFKAGYRKTKECVGANHLKLFESLPHISGDRNIVDDWGYTPSLYHFDTKWHVSWVHCEDGDVLIDYVGNTPEEAILNAYVNYGKEIVPRVDIFTLI